jgi:hypothetical protein
MRAHDAEGDMLIGHISPAYVDGDLPGGDLEGGQSWYLVVNSNKLFLRGARNLVKTLTNRRPPKHPAHLQPWTRQGSFRSLSGMLAA